jgi:hypothetical protein
VSKKPPPELPNEAAAALLKSRYVPSVPIASLVPFPGNARRGDIDKIRKSIRANGFYRPLVIQEGTNYILLGNHSAQAAVMEGIHEVPAYFVDVTPQIAKSINASDNLTSDAASYDYAALLEQLNDLSETGFELDKIGMSDAEMQELSEKAQAQLSVDLSAFSFDSQSNSENNIELPPPPANPLDTTVLPFVRLGFTCLEVDRNAIISKLNDIKQEHGVETHFEALMIGLGIPKAQEPADPQPVESK